MFLYFYRDVPSGYESCVIQSACVVFGSETVVFRAPSQPSTSVDLETEAASLIVLAMRDTM